MTNPIRIGPEHHVHQHTLALFYDIGTFRAQNVGRISDVFFKLSWHVLKNRTFDEG